MINAADLDPFFHPAMSPGATSPRDTAHLGGMLEVGLHFRNSCQHDHGLASLIFRSRSDLIAGQIEGDAISLIGGRKMQRLPVDHDPSGAHAEKTAEIDHGSQYLSALIDQDIDDASQVLLGTTADLLAEHCLNALIGQDRLAGDLEPFMPWSSQGGGPWGSGKGPWGSGPQSSGPTPPDLEELLRRSQDKLRTVLPGGSFGGRGFALIALAVLALWGFSGFFRVETDELGVVLRFGKYVRDVQPGLNYHLPYPIESALTPKALRVNKIDVGMRLVEDIRRGTTIREAPEESLMLTGDENIVDVEFSVFWLVKPGGVSEYLFNIQHPEGTVKAVAESAMREVIGRSQIQPILTGARQTIEGGVQDLMQRTLDHYGAGVQITQVQLQKVDPPAQVSRSARAGHRRVPRRA